MSKQAEISYNFLKCCKILKNFKTSKFAPSTRQVIIEDSASILG